MPQKAESGPHHKLTFVPNIIAFAFFVPSAAVTAWNIWTFFQYDRLATSDLTFVISLATAIFSLMFAAPHYYRRIDGSKKEGSETIMDCEHAQGVIDFLDDD